MNKPLTPHQLEVFCRMARQATSPRGYADSKVLGSHSGCFHIVVKGYAVSKPVYGPRGGTTWHFHLTEAGIELARRQQCLHSTYETRQAGSA